jgi:hypothetical protein
MQTLDTHWVLYLIPVYTSYHAFIHSFIPRILTPVSFLLGATFVHGDLQTTETVSFPLSCSTVKYYAAW